MRKNLYICGFSEIRNNFVAHKIGKNEGAKLTKLDITKRRHFPGTILRLSKIRGKNTKMALRKSPQKLFPSLVLCGDIGQWFKYWFLLHKACDLPITLNKFQLLYI